MSDRGGLRGAILEQNKEKIHNSLLQKNIKWSFGPLCGSHFGGIWERRIQTIWKIDHFKVGKSK